MTKEQQATFEEYTHIVATLGYNSIEADVMRHLYFDDPDLKSLMHLTDFVFETAERILWNKE